MRGRNVLAVDTFTLGGIADTVAILKEGVDILYLCIVCCPQILGIVGQRFLVAFKHVAIARVEPVFLADGYLVTKPGKEIA